MSAPIDAANEVMGAHSVLSRSSLLIRNRLCVAHHADSHCLWSADVVATTDPGCGAEREDVLTELVHSSAVVRN